MGQATWFLTSSRVVGQRGVAEEDMDSGRWRRRWLGDFGLGDYDGVAHGGLPYRWGRHFLQSTYYSTYVGGLYRSLRTPKMHRLARDVRGESLAGK